MKKPLAILLLMLAVTRLAAADLSARELERQQRNARNDKLGLRQKTAFVADSSRDFLRAPEKPAIDGPYAIAKTPPKVKLQILTHLDPEYFSGAEQYMACWANWAPVLRGDDDLFYMAASDHLGKGCDINIYQYDHRKGALSRLIDLDELLGWQKDGYTDGKVHGAMAIMPDGNLIGATHYGVFPKEEWYAAGYQGSWLFTYNLKDGTGRNLGVPLKRNSLPCFAVDTARGKLVATGDSKTFLCWDYNSGQTLFAGFPPNGWVWWLRAMLLDTATGLFWSMDTGEAPYRLLSFDPATLRFARHDATVPPSPRNGKADNLRGHTTRRTSDGFFYWATMHGALLRFNPDTPTIESVGVTWDKGRDVLQIALSPDGRYLYYQPKGYPSPLVQYNVTTGEKKAICFLQDYYFEKYGYWLGSEVYGLEISAKGDYVVMVVNGAFDGRNRSFGHPGLCVIEIPKSERR